MNNVSLGAPYSNAQKTPKTIHNMETRQIKSLHNPLVKKVLLLREKSRERKKQGCFVLEGKKELEMALKGGYILEQLFFYGDVVPREAVLALISTTEPRPMPISVSREVYRKLAYRESTEGVIALARCKSHALGDLDLPSTNPLILVAQSPEKPGNIGALLRTADGAGLGAVIIADPKTDLYNPNIVRSSLGALFTNQIAMGGSGEVIHFLKSRGIPIYGAALGASVPYDQIDFTGPSAIVVGTESTGLTQDWLAHTERDILIPMEGEIDSLNLSVSAAILIFEAKRQRALGGR